MRTRKHIRRFSVLDEKFIEPQMFDYCNRQGARTAAANAGMADEFDKIVKNYCREMRLEFLPHL